MNVQPNSAYLSRSAQIDQALSLPALLKRAGFWIRSATRADCARCTGGSRGTVSYNAEVAHCFRCHWAANWVTLARELGVLPNDPTTQLQLQEEALRRSRIEGLIGKFDVWREARIRHVSDRLRRLSRAAVLAEEVLRRFPECDEAWGALAQYYHEKSRLCGYLDFLCFTKASEWLEADSTSVEVFTMWRLHNVAA